MLTFRVRQSSCGTLQQVVVNSEKCGNRIAMYIARFHLHSECCWTVQYNWRVIVASENLWV